MIRVVETTDEFIVIETTMAGIPSRRTSIHIDAIAEGKTTLEEQIAICEEECRVRQARVFAMQAALESLDE